MKKFIFLSNFNQKKNFWQKKNSDQKKFRIKKIIFFLAENLKKLKILENVIKKFDPTEGVYWHNLEVPKLRRK